MSEQLPQVIHCIGIGGIGLSGLARFLHAAGHSVSGSDVHDSVLIHALQKEGIKVRVGAHAPTNLPANVGMVITTAASQENNPERVEAERRGIPVLLYAQALAAFFSGRRLIAVSGTHGKSTTTGLIGWGLEKLNADPSVLVGAQVAAWKGNTRIGSSDIALIEADEFARNFLAYHPAITVVTNVDYDHIETYSGFEDVLATFMQFLQQTDKNGIVVIPGDEHYTDALRESAGTRTVVTFGETAGDMTLRDVPLKLRIHGAYNMRNGIAAYAALSSMGFAPEEILKALKTFPGLWRRFEEIGSIKDARIFSDYAHHPKEVHAVLTAARELFPKKRLVVFFQPHHAERMKHFLADFARELRAADALYLADVYHVAGREESVATSVDDLASAVQSIGGDVVATGSVRDLLQQLKKDIDQHDVVLAIGAGDIDAQLRAYIQQEAA